MDPNYILQRLFLSTTIIIQSLHEDRVSMIAIVILMSADRVLHLTRIIIQMILRKNPHMTAFASTRLMNPNHTVSIINPTMLRKSHFLSTYTHLVNPYHAFNPILPTSLKEYRPQITACLHLATSLHRNHFRITTTMHLNPGHTLATVLPTNFCENHFRITLLTNLDHIFIITLPTSFRENHASLHLVTPDAGHLPSLILPKD